MYSDPRGTPGTVDIISEPDDAISLPVLIDIAHGDCSFAVISMLKLCVDVPIGGHGDVPGFSNAVDEHQRFKATGKNEASVVFISYRQSCRCWLGALRDSHCDK